MTVETPHQVDVPDGNASTAMALRGRARASWRRARALELAMAGLSYDEIAEQVGYANRGTAWRAVDEALSTRVVANVDEYRRLTLARFEALIAAHWDEATAQGSTRSADLVLKVLAQQSKLLGLDVQAGVVADDRRTVVIGGTSEEYVAALKAIAGYSERTSP